MQPHVLVLKLRQYLAPTILLLLTISKEHSDSNHRFTLFLENSRRLLELRPIESAVNLHISGTGQHAKLPMREG
jgi:hypothetical protein